VADAVDARQQLADLVAVEALADILVELLDAISQRRDVFARVADLELVNRALVAPHAGLGGLAERLRELETDDVTPVVPQLGQRARIGGAEPLRGRARDEQRRDR